jgi:predicted RND superfamily exporter protein
LRKRSAHGFTAVFAALQYITDFWDAFDEYNKRGVLVVNAYFRDVDQSSDIIHQQMEDYVNDLVAMEQITQQPFLFWLRDFEKYVEAESSLQDLTFYEQFTLFFADPVYNELYREDIVLDDSGKISSSRVELFMSNVSAGDVQQSIDALKSQRAVTKDQPINKGKDDWSFFTYHEQYLIWEFYSVAVEELIRSTILGVVSVSLIALIFIPHWSAIVFVAPLISMLYVDLLGVLQLAGIHVNAVSYVTMVVSIGLLVDFIMHVLLRYYEIHGDRETRTKEMLRTMGSSVLIGGISTFLGVIPLAFSTSAIFRTIFITFLGLVTLGIGHGLILLPVILATIGPTDCMVGFAGGEDPNLSDWTEKEKSTTNVRGSTLSVSD